MYKETVFPVGVDLGRSKSIPLLLFDGFQLMGFYEWK